MKLNFRKPVALALMSALTLPVLALNARPVAAKPSTGELILGGAAIYGIAKVSKHKRQDNNYRNRYGNARPETHRVPEQHANNGGYYGGNGGYNNGGGYYGGNGSYNNGGYNNKGGYYGGNGSYNNGGYNNFPRGGNHNYDRREDRRDDHHDRSDDRRERRNHD